ncbi:PD-(D/E)XK nuclease family transposase [Bacteroides caecimuris]|uniref:PD-(D/E)XK nuclease family transposase n=1 Tax=Bacteroides caecimuris TaxID=1796613 RepID=UPI00265829BC|nr:PD-(D/E)XK nuclease family transposase [Bacteroides caecimuris]
MADKLFFVLRNLSRLMERPKALQERIFTKLFDAAEIAKFTKEQYEAYEDSLKVYRDWQSTIATAEHKGEEKGMEKGLKQGRAEGRVEGRVEERIENARKLKKLGVATDIISQATGLSAEEIGSL